LGTEHQSRGFFLARSEQRRGLFALLAVLASALIFAALAYFEQSTLATQNPIQIENLNPGTTAWILTHPAQNQEIEGYASASSINRGESITFYVNTVDPTFTLQVFRMGWYGGMGGRAITGTIGPLPGIQQTIPPLGGDSTYGMVECNWIPSYTLTTSNLNPTQWVSGVYLVVLTSSSGLQRYIPFVVRDDSRASDLLWALNFNTYEAYNAWGGKSLYTYNSTPSIPAAQAGGIGWNSAVKVSFNRPFDGSLGAGQLLNYGDLDMVGFLEQQGYDVTYQVNLDTDQNPSGLLQHTT
jgi:hypothetical protein